MCFVQTGSVARAEGWIFGLILSCQRSAAVAKPRVKRNRRLTLLSHSVKTRIQLDPKTYNNGMLGGFKKVIQNEGAGALLTGVGPTFVGYFLQGAFKFGGYEFFKQQHINFLGYETASNYRTGVYLASSAAAEFFADVALCPLEATRIRLVSQPTFASGLLSGFGKILKNEGVGAFYAGFGPILFKQYVYIPFSLL
jgi:Mitochondrial carrier protein.